MVQRAGQPKVATKRHNMSSGIPILHLFLDFPRSLSHEDAKAQKQLSISGFVPLWLGDIVHFTFAKVA